MNDDEFKACAYKVMSHIFDVHRELGRLFHESIYQSEIAFRVGEARCEVPVSVLFEDFCKTCFLDLVVGDGVIFELKAVETLAGRHRRQLLQYLFLCDVAHGKLVNLQSGRVQHEFVNNPLIRADRTSFDVVDSNWQEVESIGMKESMIAVLRDWGTGLDVGLYEEVASYICAQPPDAQPDAEILLDGRAVSVQPVRLVAPSVALRISTLPTNRLDEYRAHLQHFLEHTRLHSIQSININRHVVQFKTLRREL